MTRDWSQAPSLAAVETAWESLAERGIERIGGVGIKALGAMAASTEPGSVTASAVLVLRAAIADDARLEDARVVDEAIETLARLHTAIGGAWVRASGGDLVEALRMKTAALEDAIAATNRSLELQGLEGDVLEAAETYIESIELADCDGDALSGPLLAAYREARHALDSYDDCNEPGESQITDAELAYVLREALSPTEGDELTEACS